MDDTLIIDGDPIIDINADGESEIVIAVGHETIVHSIAITENGHYEPEAGVDGFSSVDVDVKYQNLIDYINGITGGADTNLLDAINTLAEEYASKDMKLLYSISVDAVNSIDCSISTGLFEKEKTIVVIPDIETSLADWLYLHISGADPYDNKVKKHKHPRFFIINKGGGTYDIVIDNNSALNIRRINNITDTIDFRFFAYTKSVKMDGNINIYSSNLDFTMA